MHDDMLNNLSHQTYWSSCNLGILVMTLPHFCMEPRLTSKFCDLFFATQPAAPLSAPKWRGVQSSSHIQHELFSR